MEQYLDLVWKNYTASLPQNSNENFLDEQDDNTFIDNDLRSKIPFWIGAIVISLFFISAIIATIRYCCYTLCSSNTETEKVALMPSSVANPSSHYSSDDNETSTSSLEQSRDHRSKISIVSINRQHSRLYRHHTEIESEDLNDHYFSPTQIANSRTSGDYRRKVHDVYVLPVSPTLSSSSSTTNTDERIKAGSNTMPIRSGRYLSSLANSHDDFTNRGIRNNCFAESPQPKHRTLPRSHAGTLQHIQPPLQPPPLPPTIAQIHFNNNDTSSFQHQSTVVDSDAITLRFNTIDKNQMKKAPQPPPVPCRSQKPSPRDDYPEHTWSKPSGSMPTLEISELSSIPYDHLIPSVTMRQNSTTNFSRQYRHIEPSMLTESET